MYRVLFLFELQRSFPRALSLSLQQNQQQQHLTDNNIKHIIPAIMTNNKTTTNNNISLRATSLAFWLKAGAWLFVPLAFPGAWPRAAGKSGTTWLLVGMMCRSERF